MCVLSTLPACSSGTEPTVLAGAATGANALNEAPPWQLQRADGLGDSGGDHDDADFSDNDSDSDDDLQYDACAAACLAGDARRRKGEAGAAALRYRVAASFLPEDHCEFGDFMWKKRGNLLAAIVMYRRAVLLAPDDAHRLRVPEPHEV